MPSRDVKRGAARDGVADGDPTAERVIIRIFRTIGY